MPKADHELGILGVKAFERRGIRPDTARTLGIYTARAAGDGKIVPDPKGNVIVFPFFDRGECVNDKYRGPQKRFWQRKGGRKTFWNADVLDLESVTRECQPMAVVIVEGEIDGVTAIDAGYSIVVSVPDGAPPPRKSGESEIETTDESGKFEFMYNNRERLAKVKRFILAVDNDEPGKRLAAELLRRLSPARCSFVTYPDGCKDLNDVRMKIGEKAVLDVINNARPYPVKGLYRLSDYPPLPKLETFSTGYPLLDELYQPFLGGLTIVIGIPSHGKSALVENLVVNFAERYLWTAAIFSPEQPTTPQMRDRLRRCYLKKSVDAMSKRDISFADDWIEDHVVFISDDPTGVGEESMSLEWILQRAADAVLRDAIRILVIDPWNEIEQSRQRGESQTDYIGRALRMINTFRRIYGVLVFLLIHPTKEVGKDGKTRPPSPYDADGSAHFFNKADHFMIVHRYNDDNCEATIRVAKAKFEGTGMKGQIRLKFDPGSHRYNQIEETPLSPDAKDIDRR